MLEKVSRSKRLSCNASHQEVSRCRTRDESEESIACAQANEASQARVHPGFGNQGQTSPEVQNRGISGPTEKGLHVLQEKFVSFGKIILFYN